MGYDRYGRDILGQMSLKSNVSFINRTLAKLSVDRMTLDQLTCSCPNSVTRCWNKKIKNSLNVSKRCPKSGLSRFYLKVILFNIAQLVAKYFELLSSGFFCQELSKIAQSCHTVP